MQKTKPEGYRASQFTLHWLIAALVLFQILFGEEMAHAVGALERGQTIDSNQALQMNLHIWFGFAILGLVLLRILMRFRHGAPAAPKGGHKVITALARASHGLFYVMLVAAPMSGIAAYYFVPDAGEVHELFKPAFVVLTGLHVIASLWHQFVLHDGTLMRMLRPTPQSG